jgi:hypothetical protein
LRERRLAGPGAGDQVIRAENTERGNTPGHAVRGSPTPDFRLEPQTIHVAFSFLPIDSLVSPKTPRLL